MNRVRLAALAAACLVVSVPQFANAQSAWPFKDGDYVSVSGIQVDDGHDLEYAQHLAGMWRKGQDFAVSKGWITGYEILYNVNPRKGEPDVYLLTRFASFPTADESDARDKAYNDFMKTTEEQMQAASGERAKYRRQAGSMLLRSMKWRN